MAELQQQSGSSGLAAATLVDVSECRSRSKQPCCKPKRQGVGALVFLVFFRRPQPWQCDAGHVAKLLGPLFSRFFQISRGFSFIFSDFRYLDTTGRQAGRQASKQARKEGRKEGKKEGSSFHSPVPSPVLACVIPACVQVFLRGRRADRDTS